VGSIPASRTIKSRLSIRFRHLLLPRIDLCPKSVRTGFWKESIMVHNNSTSHSSLKAWNVRAPFIGQADAILRRRERVDEAARQRCLELWSGETRNWKIQGEVWLTPERAAP
jgi:hypothetical protein